MGWLYFSAKLAVVLGACGSGLPLALNAPAPAASGARVHLPDSAGSNSTQAGTDSTQAGTPQGAVASSAAPKVSAKLNHSET